MIIDTIILGVKLIPKKEEHVMEILPLLVTISMIGLIGWIAGLYIQLHEVREHNKIDINYYKSKLAIEVKLSSELMNIISRFKTDTPTSSWKTVLGISDLIDNVDENLIKKQYSTLAKIYHPDMPTGSVAKMQKLNEARIQAIKDI